MSKIKLRKFSLDALPHERFILFDRKSGLSTIMKVFEKTSGNMAIYFEAPKEVTISREQQRSVKDGCF